MNCGRLGVVTPLGNERRSVAAFIDCVLRHLDDNDRWFCILDNVSQDGTKDIVETLSKTDERLVYIWAPQGKYLSDAYMTGYRAAYDAGCHWVLEIDAGFSHAPEQIPQFLATMSEGYDFVSGSRFLPGGAHRSPWTRQLLSRSVTLLARKLLRSKMTDMTGGYKCLSRDAIKYILDHGVESGGNFFQVEMHQMMHRFRWKEIPIVYVNDHYSVGRPAVRESIRMLTKLALSGRVAGG